MALVFVFVICFLFFRVDLFGLAFDLYFARSWLSPTVLVFGLGLWLRNYVLGFLLGLWSWSLV